MSESNENRRALTALTSPISTERNSVRILRCDAAAARAAAALPEKFLPPALSPAAGPSLALLFPLLLLLLLPLAVYLPSWRPILPAAPTLPTSARTSALAAEYPPAPLRGRGRNHPHTRTTRALLGLRRAKSLGPVLPRFRRDVSEPSAVAPHAVPLVGLFASWGSLSSISAAASSASKYVQAPLPPLINDILPLQPRSIDILTNPAINAYNVSTTHAPPLAAPSALSTARTPAYVPSRVDNYDTSADARSRPRILGVHESSLRLPLKISTRTWRRRRPSITSFPRAPAKHISFL
ncbi:hypothetical protein B0H17DRAFT_1132820 [Mycena rosella]|uniref:Uncharacterized protein n=1 Tax=Mycena rosella TaxID=1033263 RepID=A0AAD7DIY0_MYCRO|nr:hypothetical protein B0H17DRAFT_1132820 [Mycena rosella]